ncbi:hypothetical protein [Pseudohalioglobus lutimaris]|uniref:hypothetical protein n=1 Tax=Pseudohalioglobus lutimaris TaxID=1737061 RepID=UPI001A9DC8D3|nr:hypothetical protein [Pseudohalioglobus lutimaris]
MKYLLIVFILGLAVAPLTHFLPSKRQRQLARMREYAAVHGLFVEFRDLPAAAGHSAQAARTRQVIYYGKRLVASRGEPRQRRAWLREDDGWRGLQRRWEEPVSAAVMPASVMALGVDEGSCGAYWMEDGEESDVEVIVEALQLWAGALSGKESARIS